GAWDRGWWAGYPELQFYPPGFAYLGALLAWPTTGVLDIGTVYQALLWLAYLLPGVTTYVVLARLTGLRWLALPGAFVALTLSAGVAGGVEGGVRTGMVGARLAWALLPSLLGFLARWAEDERPLSPAVPLLLAAVTLLHPAQLPAAVALVVLAACARGPWWQRARGALRALILAAALTAFWTLPLFLRLAETRGLARRLDAMPIMERLGVSPRSAAFGLGAAALFALLSLGSDTLMLRPGAGVWPSLSSIERGLRLPDFWSLLGRLPEGRLLFVRS